MFGQTTLVILSMHEVKLRQIRTLNSHNISLVFYRKVFLQNEFSGCKYLCFDKIYMTKP
jgi:hypothetical protein